MLAPRLQQVDVLDGLAKTWAERGQARVGPLLREREAVRMLGALRGREHQAIQGFGAAAYQLWRTTWQPGTGCAHPLCELGRWLRGDGAAWVSAIVGRELTLVGDELMADRLCKASYFDAYDEQGLGVVGFSLQLTPMTWPESFGGYLEVLESAAGPVAQRLGPAWNTLDLFALQPGQGQTRGPDTWRRMPLVVEHVEGHVVSGWFAAR